MPLLEGSSDEIIQKNIQMLIDEGKTPEEATAIAYRNAGKELKDKKTNGLEKSTDFESIQLFKTGNYNGSVYNQKHIDDMVAFYNDHKNILPDIKIDHIDSKSDRDKEFAIFKNFPFSLGKIENLKADGEWLTGDYINVFEPIKNALKDKLLTTHSIECYFDVESTITKKKYSAVLSAVSLLPAGTLPALMEVFKPYMYQLEKQDNTEVIKVNVFNLNDFKYKDKLVCKFGVKESMTEQEYKDKMKKYEDAYMKVKSFETFTEMEDEKKDYYMKYLENNYKKYKDMMSAFAEEDMMMPKKGEYKEMADKKEIENNQDLDKGAFDFQAILNQNADLQKKLNSLIEAKENENKLMQDTIKRFETKEKSDRVEKVLFSLVKSDNPKLLPANEDKARNLLMKADSKELHKFSINDKEVEKSVFDLAVELLESLPEVKQVHEQESIVKSEDGNFSVTKNEVESGLDPESVIASKKLSSKHENFSKLSEAEQVEILKSEGLLV